MIMFVLLYVLLFIFLVFFNGTISALLKQKFAVCMPISLIAAALILYFTQLIFKTFQVGLILLLVIAVLAIPLFLLKKIRVEFSLWQGVLLFALIFVLYFIIDFQSRFHSFDEYFHWGQMVKESLRLDRFYAIPESNIWIHKEYPPFMCMLQYLWCRMTGGYSEMTVLHATNVFNMSLLLMPLSVYVEKIFQNKKREVLYKGFLLFFLFLSLILAFDPWKVSNTILVDITVPCLFAFGFLVIYQMKGDFTLFAMIELALAESALLMTKKVGIAFMLILNFYLLLELLIRHRESSKRLKKAILYVVTWIVPLICYFSWSLYIKRFEIVGQFSVRVIDPMAYLQAIAGPGFRHETLKHYTQALFTENITTIQWLPMTYAASAVLIFLWILLLWHFGKKYVQKRQILLLGISFAVGTVGYAFLMSVLYLFTFSEAEMAELASYSRYMSSYVVGEAVILFSITLLILHKCLPEIKKGYLLAAMLASLIIWNPANIYNMIPISLHGKSMYAIDQDADFVRNHTEPGDNICIIYDDADAGIGWYGAYDACMQYYVNDRHVYRSYWDAYTYDAKTLADTVVKDFDKIDAVFIRNSNEAVNEVFSEYLDGKEVVSPGIYRVGDNGNGFILERE